MSKHRATEQAGMTGPETGQTTTRLLQRQILPSNRDTDVIRLYVDPDPLVLDADKYEVGTNKNAQELNALVMRQAVGTGAAIHPDQIESRTAMRVKSGEKLSFGSYFNAFPASYWRKWTVVTDVTLTVRLSGHGATVTVYRSLANGRSQRVDSATTEGTSGEFSFELPLKPFVDGGWYWYDVVAADEDAVVEGAEWTASVPEERAQHGSVTIGITTMNRQDFCAKLLVQLGEDELLQEYLDEVLVMEQGKELVVDSEFFPEAQKELGDKLRIIDQGNIGGSGGFARAQYETLQANRSTYALMLDDDVECETEGIIRALTFADLSRRPTIVGGHMFSLFAKARLHSFGEKVQPYTFWWGPAPGVFTDWDLGSRNLRSARWLHSRVDVDYNGWFMCLIPTDVIREIGLSLPLFLKWDDSEYGLRAKDAGYPTVTLPGAAVWHVPWTDKNDALDWQSYFHQRNRLHRGAAPLQVPQGWSTDHRELQPPDQAPGVDAVLHRGAAAPGARGRPRGPGPAARRARHEAARGPSAGGPVHRCAAQVGPRRLPGRGPHQAAPQGPRRRRHPDRPAGDADGDHASRCGSCASRARCRRSTRRRRSPPRTPSGTASRATTRRWSRCRTARRPRSTSGTRRSSRTS